MSRQRIVGHLGARRSCALASPMAPGGSAPRGACVVADASDSITRAARLCEPENCRCQGMPLVGTLFSY
eukprot:11168843-Lingulodinium_polyedra.AAC.1